LRQAFHVVPVVRASLSKFERGFNTQQVWLLPCYNTRVGKSKGGIALLLAVAWNRAEVPRTLTTPVKGNSVVNFASVSHIAHLTLPMIVKQEFHHAVGFWPNQCVPVF
jgi:hypothetical protein